MAKPSPGMEIDTKGLSFPFKTPPETGHSLEVVPGVHWVRMPLPFRLDHINLWLLEDGDGWTLVDTGISGAKSKGLWETLFGTLLQGRPIKRVIVTHLHPDHAGLAGWFAERFDCMLWMSRTDYLMCRTLVLDTGREAPEEGIRFYRAAGYGPEDIERYRERFGMFGTGVHPMPNAFRRIVDGETIEIGGNYWQVVMGSGHAPEHACLYCPALKLLISGDQVLPKISSNVSVFPTEPQGDPLKDWIRSCEKLRDQLPGDLMVLPAHNEPFYGLHKRLTDLIENHEAGLERLYELLKEKKRAVDCFSVLFKRTVGPEILGMATGEALAHLNCLVGRRLARRERDAEGVDWYQRIEGHAEIGRATLGFV